MFDNMTCEYKRVTLWKEDQYKKTANNPDGYILAPTSELVKDGWQLHSVVPQADEYGASLEAIFQRPVLDANQRKLLHSLLEQAFQYMSVMHAPDCKYQADRIDERFCTCPFAAWWHESIAELYG